MARQEWTKRKHFETSFLDAMGRMQVHCHVRTEDFAPLAYDFRRLAERVGIDVFVDGITRMLEERDSSFTPTIPEFKRYLRIPGNREYCETCHGDHWIPDGNDEAGNPQVKRCEACKESRNWKPSAADYEDRRQHPENYWGEPDILCMMRAQASRIAAKQPLYTAEQVEQIILAARKKYGKSYGDVFKPVSHATRNPNNYEMTEADYA